MPCTPSIFAGLDQSTLQAWLLSAQTALIDLQTGSKVVTVGYAQGDGSKNVTYTQARLGDLTMLIRQLQAELGIIRRPRRALGVRF